MRRRPVAAGGSIYIQGDIMRNSYGQMGALLRTGACLLAMHGLATPAAAQFGGLKKKLKAEAASEGAKQAGVSDVPGANAAAGKAGAAGGSVVLTPEVVDQMLAGLKAQQAYRENAQTADTPYGRYNKASEAYETARAKCEAGHQAFLNRMASDEKLLAQYSEMVNKMTDAMGRGDSAAVERYQHESQMLEDPSCAVKQPQQPDDYYQSKRDIDSKAEQEGLKKSGLSQAEYAMALERGEGILRNSPPPDASESETKAVNARAAELKPLLHIQDETTTRTMKPAPAPAPVPVAVPAPAPQPGVTQAQMDMGNCVSANAQKHQKEIEALGERAKAAQQAGDMPKTMAIADSINRLQMAGCNNGR
jgi:hypothetical protein